MPTFFIILIFTYLGGNAYIFYRGLQTLSGFPYGIKILLTILFWLAALSFFGTMLSRNVKIPFYLSHTMYEVGTGWLIFTLYMVLFLLFFDLLKLCSISFNQSFMTSLLATFVLLGYGYYNYRHPKINTVNITLTKPLTDNRRPIKIVAVSDIHLGNGTGKTSLKQYVKMINGQNPDLILIGGDLIDNSVIPLYAENMAEGCGNQGCRRVLRRFGRQARDWCMGQSLAYRQPGLYAGLPRSDRPVRQRIFPLSCKGR